MGNCGWYEYGVSRGSVDEITVLKERLKSTEKDLATLRHDLLNEQAASLMAHEVVARNRALEKELVETQEQLEVWRNDERQRCMDVARLFEVNSALEAENAQLRHALANAQVAAGFAKEMAGKVKELQGSLVTLDRQIARWRQSSNRHLGKLIMAKGEIAVLRQRFASR